MRQARENGLTSFPRLFLYFLPFLWAARLYSFPRRSGGRIIILILTR